MDALRFFERGLGRLRAEWMSKYFTFLSIIDTNIAQRLQLE